MRVVYLTLACRDLAQKPEPGQLVDEFFRARENRLVMGAFLHYHRTHRRETHG